MSEVILNLNTDWTLLYDLDSNDVIARLYCGFIDYVAWHKSGQVEVSEGVPVEIIKESTCLLKEQGVLS